MLSWHASVAARARPSSALGHAYRLRGVSRATTGASTGPPERAGPFAFCRARCLRMRGVLDAKLRWRLVAHSLYSLSKLCSRCCLRCHPPFGVRPKAAEDRLAYTAHPTSPASTSCGHEEVD
eukprot:6179908-Pleurochrysis_carterae.AAC.8